MGYVTVAYDSVGRPASFGNKRVSMGTITMSASYATGGDSILAGDQKFGLAQLDALYLFPPLVGTHNVGLDSRTAPTLVLAYHTGAAVATPFDEEAGTTDVSSLVIPFMAVGA